MKWNHQLTEEMCRIISFLGQSIHSTGSFPKLQYSPLKGEFVKITLAKAFYKSKQIEIETEMRIMGVHKGAASQKVNNAQFPMIIVKTKSSHMVRFSLTTH